MLGSLIRYLKAMTTVMFQLSGFYYKLCPKPYTRGLVQRRGDVHCIQLLERLSGAGAFASRFGVRTCKLRALA